jgi:hypothetical protein
MNNLSILGLKQILAHILELRKLYSTTYQRVWFDTPVLRQPQWQSLQILPISYLPIMEDVVKFMKQNQIKEGENRFDGFKDYEVQRMERDLTWMKNGKKLNDKYIHEQRADFYRFFSEYDKRREAYDEYAKPFDVVFPQMKEFWNECKYHAEKA